MRLLLLNMFLFFAAANGSVNSHVSDADLRTIAGDLLRKTITSVNHVNNIHLLMISIKNRIDKMKTTYDFQIPNHPQIIKLEGLLNNYKVQNNTIACRKLKKDNMSALTQELRKLLTRKVNGQIEKYSVTLSSIHKTLQNIFNKIQGKNLNKEINFCNNNPHHCRLIIQYSSDISNGEEIINSMNYILNNLIELTLQGMINPTLSTQIYNLIYKPVMYCINKIKT